MASEPMEQTRANIEAWRNVITAAPNDYEQSTFKALVALMDATDAVLALHVHTCEINGPNAACGESCTMNICGPCGENYPCATRQAIETHTRNLQ